MLRPKLKSMIRCLTEAQTKDNYSLYLLSDNSPAALKQAKKLIDYRNAILLYPDPNNMNKMGLRRYIANVIQNGKSFAIVAMGKQNFNKKRNLPDANNLMKVALAKAGIVVTPLLQTIRPVFRVLASDMSNRSLTSFARISLFSNHLAQPMLDQRLMKELFKYILEGNIAVVKKMLKIHPRLALIKWNAENADERIITNMAGQRILVQGKTPYQLALGEEDTEIAETIKTYIADENEAKKQYLAQFPDGWEADEEKRWASVFEKLDTLTQAIRTATPGDITSSGYPEYQLTVKAGSNVETKFIEYTTSLNAILNEVVITGRHFNPKLPLKAFEIYDKHYKDYFGNKDDDPRAMLFWQRVHGSIQCLMPANYVQAFCSGLQTNVERIQRGDQQGRSFGLYIARPIRPDEHWEMTNFYPLSNTRLGIDHAIDPNGLLTSRNKFYGVRLA